MNILETIKSASETAQRCQRNWDLSKTIPDDILEVLQQVVINAPSKQNEEYYSVIFCTDRDIIENIYNNTLFGSTYEDLDINKNSQVLANLLVIFCKENHVTDRNDDTDYTDIHTNRQLALGIASGQLALAASLLGFKTGFCKCFDNIKLNSILGLNKQAELLLGIGYPDTFKNRREHQYNNTWYPSYNKDITILTIKNKNIISEKFPLKSSINNICVYFDYTNTDINVLSKSPVMDFLKQNKKFDLTQYRIDTQLLRKSFNVDPAMLARHYPEKKLVVHTYTGDSQEDLNLFKSNLLEKDETVLFLNQHKWLIS